MNERSNAALPLVITFAILTILLAAVWLFVNQTKIEIPVLICANLIFFVTSLMVFRMQTNAMKNPNAGVFIRSVMGGMAIKMMVCLVAVMGYVLGSNKQFNKPAVYISVLIYLLYLIIEVGLVMKLNKRKNA
jgi:hypothetical protein